MKKKFELRCLWVLSIFIMVSGFAGAQTISDDKALIDSQGNTAPDMATGFYAEGKIYVVIGVVAIVLAGIFLYLMRLDKKMNKLENEVKNNHYQPTKNQIENQ